MGAFAECSSLEACPEEVEQLCGSQGIVQNEDDDTAEVSFESLGKSLQLPLNAFEDVMLQVCHLEQLKPEVEKHSALKWHERLADTCEQHGVLLKVDTDGTSNLRFPGLDSLEVWLPSNCLTDPNAASTTKEGSSQGSPAKGSSETDEGSPAK